MIFVFPSSRFHPKNYYLYLNWCYKNKVFQDTYMLIKDAGLNQSIAGRFSGSSNEKAQKLSGALFLRGANHSMYAINFANKMGKNYTTGCSFKSIIIR